MEYLYHFVEDMIAEFKTRGATQDELRFWQKWLEWKAIKHLENRYRKWQKEEEMEEQIIKRYAMEGELIELAKKVGWELIELAKKVGWEL